MLADIIEKDRRRVPRQPKAGLKFISFVTEGQAASGRQTTGILHQARHWEMKAGLIQKLVFPDVFQTSLCPELMSSTAPKKMMVISNRRSL